MCSVVLGLLLAEGILRWWDVADTPAFAPIRAMGTSCVPISQYRLTDTDFASTGSGDAARTSTCRSLPDSRVAFLGDFITYGGGTNPDPNLFANRVASSLSVRLRRPGEVVNVSAPNWGIGNSLSFVEAVGLFGAERAVWVIPSADIRRPPLPSAMVLGFPPRNHACGWPLSLGLLDHVLPVSLHPNAAHRVLDTFDWHSPKYQSKHTYEEFFRWFESCGLDPLRILQVPVAVRGGKTAVALEAQRSERLFVAS